MARLGCLFILLPVVELALLLRVGQWLGLWPTVGLVALTGVLGAWLVRTEGVRTMARFQAQVARGELPGRVLMDGAAILVGGAFLLTPGILTDAVGFALLFPPTRRLLQDQVTVRLAQGIRSGRIQVVSTGFGWGGGPAGRPPGPTDDDEDPPRPPRPGEIIQ